MKKLYAGGTVLTMDLAAPRAEAVLTENGKIVAVGKRSDFETVQAERIDLKGRTLMPAFVDGHSHAVSVGLNKNRVCDLMGCTSFDDLLERIRRFRKEKNLVHGEAILSRGYDPAIMKEESHPTAKILDSLGFDNPVSCVHQSGHIAVYNTVAMKMAGLDLKNFVCTSGGFAGRDENGNLNGYFEEGARKAVSHIFSTKRDYEDYREALITTQAEYARHGFATIHDGSQNGPSSLSYLRRGAEEGLLKMDLVAYVGASAKLKDFRAECKKTYGSGYVKGLKVGGVKLFLDGSPQARTAWLSEPYEGEAEYRGYPMMEDDALEARLRDVISCGLQPIAHCNGDAASEQFVKALEKLRDEGMPVASLRPVMIHAQTVRLDQLRRMKKLGMMPSFFVGHCYYWGDTHLKNLGERGERISPMKQAMDEGLICSIHQDSPVTEPNMLHSVWCAVNRITRSGVIVGAENRISCYDALIAATRGGAYTYFEENTKGLLRSGAQADFVILDQDPTAVDPMRIKEIKVLSTVKNDDPIFIA